LLRNAALLLGARGARRARPALMRALGDASEQVRHAAAWALSRL
jgi:HEAT repeat protein